MSRAHQLYATSVFSSLLKPIFSSSLRMPLLTTCLTPNHPDSPSRFPIQRVSAMECIFGMPSPVVVVVVKASGRPNTFDFWTGSNVGASDSAMQYSNLGSSTSVAKDMIIQQARTLELPSAVFTNSLDLPLMYFLEVTSEATLTDKCRAPVPGAFYFDLYLASLRNGGRQLLVKSDRRI
ncbi:hypothetical protein P692DRAFT_20883204 [Suillus brevipes Sb2]|nr:hypothetical protein P692DRAFT_20883204 [Suillus brevipes Sb2]